MRKLLIFKHIAQENLGSLRPVLRDHGFRLRYVNFDREPDARPELERYRGLVVLGGWMGVYEAEAYPHISRECQLIEQALKQDMPVLGICLGAQILAHVLGASVRKHTQREVGWQQVSLTKEGRQDPIFSSFGPTETVFQMHGDTFDVPQSAVHLAFSSVCEGQAFRYGQKAYGLQFHLEADQAMIQRFLRDPENRAELEFFGDAGRLEPDTEAYLPRSLELSQDLFSSFFSLFGMGDRLLKRKSRHGLPG